jgi:2-dehydro-3-deoxygluconokinase
MKRIALLGECLIELNGTPFGALQQTFGGDSLNTALYLSRLTRGTSEVKYVSVVGQDLLSDGMVERWRAEGIDTSLVLRDSTRLPGVYWIQVDERGERSFLYWRGESAARYLLQHPDFDRVTDELAQVDMIFLSGISLAILPAPDRAKLIELLTRLAARGVTIALDSNYRPALWLSPESARAAMSAILPIAQLLFVTFDDEHRSWGDETVEATLARLSVPTTRSVAIKRGAAGCLYSHHGMVMKIAASPVPAVVDTTAAGDAFNAGFLAGWIMGRCPEECCQAGNALAGVVIQHRGAIIPALVTPPLSALLPHQGSLDTGFRAIGPT